MTHSPTLYAYRGLRLRMGDNGPVLVLRPGSSRADSTAPEFALVSVDGRWRLPANADLSGACERLSRDNKPPESIRGFVFIDRIALNTTGPSHPALDVVTWVMEGSSPTDPTLTIGIEEDTGPIGYCEGLERDDEGCLKVLPAFAGTVWIRHEDARLAIGVIPRNLVSAREVRQATEHHADNPLESAMCRLDRIVSDLWDRSLLRSNDSGTPGAALRSGPAEAARFQQLARLHDLVMHRGVREAWQAMAADPVVRLVSRHPVVPLSRARVPVLHGERGPWSLARGWSPSHPLGEVRERVVDRTVDTPPNRLAIALAARVIEELDEILAGTSNELMDAMAEPIRRASLDTLYAPSLHGVDPQAPIALDSPSLQANTRCGPLLDAWHQLVQGVAPDPLHLDQLMLEPLTRAHQLYERWCFVRLTELVEAALGTVAEWDSTVHPESGTNGVLVATCSRSSDDRSVEIYHFADTETSTTFGRAESIDNDGDSPSTGPYDSWDETKLVSSWSPVQRPDGFLVVRRAGKVVAVHAWDAKYRPLWEGKSRDAGYLYQAHAFRDTLRWKEGDHRIAWSVVLHPGLAGTTISGTAYLVGSMGRGQAIDHVRDWGGGGVAIAALAPNASERQTVERTPADALVQALCLH